MAPDELLRDAEGNLRSSAYYFDFELTGVDEVDRILAAVCKAGKAYHHTSEWDQEDSPIYGDPEKRTYVGLIQQVANEAAEAFRTQPR